MFHHLHLGLVNRYNPLLKVAEGGILPSVDNLNPSLTINSVTNTPNVRYKGGDAGASTWAAWTYGNTLTLTGTGNSPSINKGSPLMNSNDDSVQGPGVGTNKYYQVAAGTDADIATEDIVAELLIRIGSDATTGILVGKRTAAAAAGWMVAVTNGRLAQFNLTDGTTPANIFSGTLTANAWNHVMFFIDRSGSGQCYVNGAVSGSAVSVSTIGSLSNTSNKLTIFAYSSGLSMSDDTLAYFSLWLGSGWLDTHLQANVAKERFQRMLGLWPDKAQGTALASSITRASSAYLDVLSSADNTTRRLYLVDSGWIRSVRRKDSNNNILTGPLFEASVQNLSLQTEVFTNATWSKLTAGDTVTDNTASAPNLFTTAASLTADGTTAQHGISQSNTLTAATHTLSIWAKVGNQNWLGLATSSPSSIGSYFDLSNGVVGTAVGSPTNRFIENWGNGWYRCGFSFTGTAASWTYQVYSASGDNSTTFAGDGATVNTYLWGSSMTATQFMTSYIPNTSSANTRSADQLVFVGNDGNFATVGSGQQGMVFTKFFAPNYNFETTPSTWAFSDGTNNNRIAHFTHAANEKFRVLITSSGVSRFDTQGTSDPVDGQIHSSRTRFTTSLIQEYFDGSVEIRAGAATGFPQGLNVLYMGSFHTGASQFDGVVSSFRIYGRPTNKI